MLPVFLVAVGFLAQAEPAAEPSAPQEIPLELRVHRAIALGVEHLRGIQASDGSFAGYEGEHPGGSTAFAAFTLAKSGVRRSDPVLTRALTALAGNEFKSVYSASVHLLLCEALHDPAQAAAAQRSLDFLLENRQRGVWAYPWGHLCNSNTQFALLALRAARRMGLEVPEQALVDAVEGLKIFRDPSGGFTYAPGDKVPNAGITAAALASLAVLQEAAAELPRLRGALERNADMRKDAEAWLGERFDPGRNLFNDHAWMPAWQYSYLWAVERWCGLTKRDEIDGRDWYAEGATWLLENQDARGSFGNGSFTDTCFALLFLRRATVTPDAELAEIYAKIEHARGERPRRPRTFGDDALRLTEWWLAGPWRGSENAALWPEPPFDPGDVRPRERGKVARQDWERVTLQPDRWTNLEILTERKGNFQQWVLATWLSVPGVGESANEVLLWLEVDEGWDVWLDGKRVSRERRRMPSVASASMPVSLAPGEHLLVVVVEDVFGPSAFGALLSDPAGRAPLAGLRERSEPASQRGR